jgi:hypothetical protein
METEPRNAIALSSPENDDCSAAAVADDRCGLTERGSAKREGTGSVMCGDAGQVSGASANGRDERLRADCPMICLKGILSGQAFRPLERAYMAPFDPPHTVGEVAELYRQGRLSEIRGLGRRRIGEIEVCLALAGLVHGHRHPA